MKDWVFIRAQKFVTKLVQGIIAVTKIDHEKFLNGVFIAAKQIKEIEPPEDWDFSFANDEPEEDCANFQSKFLEGIDPLINRELMRVCRE
jgi:hypothetical protein